MQLLRRISPYIAISTTLVLLMIALLLWHAGQSPMLALKAETVAFLEKWQTLVAGVVAVFGGALVLVAARWQIAHERDLAQEVRRDRVVAAKIRLAYQLEILGEGLMAVAERRNILIGLIPAPAALLPLPGYLNDMSELTQIHPWESERLLDLVRRIELANSRLSLHNTLLFRTNAAAMAITAFNRRDAIAGEIGWRQMPRTKKKIAQLQAIIARVTNRTE